MLTKRIIPCLDVKDGRTVKGIHFEQLTDVGDPVELAAFYSAEGADELVFLDITATVEGRKTFGSLVRRIAAQLNIPFTVGGGINSVADVDRLLESGADKVSVNSAAVRRPELISEIAQHFGSQVIVVAIDVRENAGVWHVQVNGGRTPTDRTLLEWAKEAEARGAGEILLTSMNHDGAKTGFATAITAQVSSSLHIPIIASGGAGELAHFAEVLQPGRADAALAASVFHYNQIPIRELKGYLAGRGIAVRI